ncbi:MAG: hypothetical protein ACEPOZ_05860 [Marinifilaceae bacterium]
MDDKWGDILYLLLMVLLLVVGALKKNKANKTAKPVPNEASPGERGEKSSGFETVLEALLGKEVVHTFEPEEDLYQNENQRYPDEVIELEEDEIDQVMKEPERIQTMEERKKSPSTDEDEVAETEEIDWRQAIIYSEIINRKYN